MAHLQEIYDSLWEKSLRRFEAADFELDGILNNIAQDGRRGITLIGRLELTVTQMLHRFLEECRTLEPEQHYYSRSDMHLTVLSIISCYTGFQLDSLDLNSYIGVIKEALRAVGPFRVAYHGITASPSCVMVQGFPTDDSLSRLREHLRDSFRHSSLECSIDQRYSLETAHSTIIRFQKSISDNHRLLDLLKSYRECDFGVSEYRNIELVYNDWYMTDSVVRTLETFPL